MSQLTELRPFQWEGVRAIRDFRGRALLADDQGLGKTLQALKWISLIYKHRPAIIVTPASLKWTWQAEAALHLNLHTHVLEGRRRRGQMLAKSKGIFIINYEILHSWLPALLRLRPLVVVFDEVHYLQSPDAQRTQSSWKLVQFANSVVGLSGTPMTDKPIQLWSILQLIRPDIFPDRSDYAWKFCKPRFTRWGWRYDGAANTKKLHRILREQVMIRRLKEDVAKDLPNKQRKIVYYQLKKKQRSEYLLAQDSFLKWLRRINPAKANRAKRTAALTRVGYLMRLVAQMKLPWTEQWIKEFLEVHPDKKLVAFTMNTFVIDYLKQKFRCVVVDGRIRGTKRRDAIRAFQSNPRIRLLLGNWRAAGVGHTLTAAHNTAGLDFPWTPGDMLQGEDRIHRIGQKKDCLISYLVTANTIEESLMKTLQKKAKVLRQVLDGKRSTKDVNIFLELISNLSRQ